MAGRVLGMAVLSTPAVTRAWTGAHNEASQMAARIAPPPFKDHPDWCAYANYPELMRDWGIGHGTLSRWSLSLLIDEAARPEAMGHVLDVLLDEARAPLWSSSPPGAALQALREVWTGVRLVQELRARRLPPRELFAYVRPRGKPVPFVHNEEDRGRFTELLKETRREPGLHGWLTWWAKQG